MVAGPEEINAIKRVPPSVRLKEEITRLLQGRQYVILASVRGRLIAPRSAEKPCSADRVLSSLRRFWLRSRCVRGGESVSCDPRHAHPHAGDELYALVWTEPIQKIAPRYGLSDRGFGKLCERYNIPVPPRGYWAKKSAGKRATQPRLPPSQRSRSRR